MQLDYNGNSVTAVTYIMEEKIPHTISEVICVRCCKRWIAVRPMWTLLKELECPNCGKGAVIETGQVMDEE